MGGAVAPLGREAPGTVAQTALSSLTAPGSAACPEAMGSAVTCPKCGHHSEADAKFCSQCATALAASGGQVGFPEVAPSLPAGSNSPVPRKRIGRLIVVGALIQAVAIAAFFMVDCSGKTEGEIRSVGKPLGDFAMEPPACHSGEHESFFGVWAAPKLETLDGRTGFRGGLKVVKNQVGEWEVYVENPNSCEGFDCPIVQVERQHCSVFDVHVQSTNTTVNDIRLRQGHARLDCEFPEGGTLTANLTFSGRN